MTGEEQMEVTENRRDQYNSLVKRKIILVNQALLDKYPFRLTRFSKLYTNDENMVDNIVSKYGITDRFFGGNVAKAGQVYDSPFVVLADSDDYTIGILIPNENLSMLTVDQLKEVMSLYKIDIPKDAKKQDLINLLTSEN